MSIMDEDELTLEETMKTDENARRGISLRINDGDNWSDGTASGDITGLSPGTYYVRYKATDTTNASDNQELTIAGYYKVTYKVVNGTWSDDSTTDKTETVKSGSKPASVPTGMKVGSGFSGGVWDTDPANTTITGATTFTYAYTKKPSSTPTSPSSTPTTPVKSTAYVLTAPVANTLTYNGQARELVTEGRAIGGMMHYAVGTSETTAPNDGWSAKAPTATDAGTYFIWYKVVGDSDHKDLGPSYVGAAEIIEKHSDNVISIDEEKGIATVKDAVSGGTTEVPLYIIIEGLVYRMYNPNSGEHFYTKNPDEAELLVQLGWIHESDSDFTVVNATEEDAIPVYRLYNPNCGGMHFYTDNAEEAKYLKSIGWNYEGISHYVYNASVRGKGIGKEMIKLAVCKAFTDPEVLAVQLNVFPENARAKRCYEGVGFTERHNTPDAFKYKDESWGRCNMIIKRSISA